MEILRQTFDYYLTIAEENLAKASKESNPAKWLYKNNFRTPLFMLEALTRVYQKIADKKIFEKLNKHFKSGEDLIGEIDFFYYYAEILEDEKVKADLTKKAVDKEEEYNKLLAKKDWLNGKRIKKIREKISDIPNLDIEEETAKIKDFYKNEIAEIISFSKTSDFKFEDIEDDVHEIRRDLRWLSIYPQAFLGLFKYADNQEKQPEYIQKYLTDNIVNSPYNVFPTTLNFNDHILINKDYFFALSWVIDAIGDLKDEGLKTEASHLVDADTPKEVEIATLLKRSEEILVPFFKEENLNHLVQN